MSLKFQVNLAEVSLNKWILVVEGRNFNLGGLPLSLFLMYFKFQVNLAEVSLRPMETNLTEKLKTVEIGRKG